MILHLPFLIVSIAVALASYLKGKKLFSPFVILSLLSPGLLYFDNALAYLAGGMIFLICAADFLTEGASKIARNAGVPPLVTGILIIGLGTSMPELFVNILSALEGSTGLALGNIMGSNIANMGLVIGAGGLIAGNISIQKSLISREIPIMLGATILMILLSWEFQGHGTISQGLSFNDGLILILALLFYLLYTFQTLKKDQEPQEIQQMFQGHYEDGKAKTTKTQRFSPVMLVILGIAGLYFGGNYIIKGALDLAQSLGAGDIALGIIVGVGTSLPELAAAISSARKGETDLIVGNVVGSNIFNILLVLGVTAIITPVATDKSLLIHFAILLSMTLVFMIFLGSQRKLNRIESALLTLGGLGYLVYGLI
ncbi:MAG: calcium/sodium antiporter [Spirochaetaceae bacterium]|jgi:cation:H+ antiporter|nr:calcium/sodium antiporter [Spirochaetaceae bacterium]